jgi:hypothetical protein
MHVILATLEAETKRIMVEASGASSHGDPFLKKPITKKGWWVAQGVGPEFKPQYQ